MRSDDGAGTANGFQPHAAAARLTRAFAEIVDESAASGFGGGCAVDVWQDGKPLVSLQGGEARPGSPWTAATPCLIWSASKGLAAACTLHALN